MDQLPAQTVIMGRGSILGLVFALFIASVQAKISNDCHLIDDDGSAVGDLSRYSSRNETTGWVGEPDTRGSMTIVTTCIVTLGLCVWTSIHVNVQIDRLSFYRLRRKVATSVKALIFPNLVVESAHDEWAEMTRLYEGLANLRKIMADTRPEPSALQVENPKDAASQEESEKDPIESASPIPDDISQESAKGASITYSSPVLSQSTPINMSPDAASQEPSNGSSPKSTWFKRVIGMAEKPEDPHYPFSKEVCFFVVMGGFVRPGRENALPAAGGGATTPPNHQKPPPANETLTSRKEHKLRKAEKKLREAETELATVRAELTNANAESKTERKLAKAEHKLAKAKAKLAKARLPIFKITPEDFFNAYARNPDKFRRLIKSKEKDILDKGNASNIAKLIIMAQVTKLVLQMIGRKAMGLSVAVLELHIFCHILIAGLLYSYWWYKQLDVNEPMVLDIGDRYFAPDPMWSYYPERALPPTRFVSWQRFWKRFDPLVWLRIETRATLAMAKAEQAKALALTIKQINEMRFEGKAGVLEPPAPRLAVPNRSETDKNTPSRSNTSHFPPNPPKHARPECEPYRKSLLTKAKFESNRRAMWFYIAYAGLHATVWGIENFPTWQEKWLWRGACIAVAVVPAVGAASEYMKYLRSLWNGNDEEKNPGELEKGGTPQDATDKEKLKWFTLDWFLGFLTLKWLLEFVYLLASVALLAESFAILRAEDARTYEIKSWTAELPLGR